MCNSTSPQVSSSSSKSKKEEIGETTTTTTTTSNHQMIARGNSTGSSTTTGSVRIRRPSRLSTARSVFEQNIQKNSDHEYESSILTSAPSAAGTKRRVQAKSRRVSLPYTNNNGTFGGSSSGNSSAVASSKAPKAATTVATKTEPRQQQTITAAAITEKTRGFTKLQSFQESEDEDDSIGSVCVTEAETDPTLSFRNSPGETSLQCHTNNIIIEDNPQQPSQHQEEQHKQPMKAVPVPQHLEPKGTSPSESEARGPNTAHTSRNVGGGEQQQRQQQPSSPTTEASTPQSSSIPAAAAEVNKDVATGTPPPITKTPTRRPPMRTSGQSTRNLNLTAARTIQRVSRQFSNKNKVRREGQSVELQKLAERREKEVARLERIKQGRKAVSIRMSLHKFEDAMEKNKGFGFDSVAPPPPGDVLHQKHRQENPRVVAADEELSDDDESGAGIAEFSIHQDAALLLPVDEFLLDGDGSLKMEQLQAMHDNRKQQSSNGITVPKAARTAPRRALTLESRESTLLTPIRDRGGDNINNNNDFTLEVEESMDSEDEDETPPIPAMIRLYPDDCGESQITFCDFGNTSIAENNSASRWESHATTSPKPKEKDDGYTPQICYRTPQAATMTAEGGSRWAIHPRVVYGPPKTKLAVNPPNMPEQTLSESKSRWAASTSKKKKIFPQNVSRWAAQPKDSTTTAKADPTSTRPAGAAKRRISKKNMPQHMPRRQASQDNEGPPNATATKRRPRTNGAPAPRLPQRKRTSEGKDFPLKHLARRGRRGVSISKDDRAITNSMPMLDRSIDDDATDTKSRDDSILFHTSQSKLGARATGTMASRTKSLGEVKKITAATRIQSICRMLLQQHNYKMALQQRRKDDLKNETAQEVQDIQDTLETQKRVFREKMLQEHSLGLDDDEDDTSTDDVAAALRREIAEFEGANAKIQRQSDRLEATNKRMGGGNKTRESAVKEVTFRLKKLQHIQSKLAKVHKEFQNEHATAQKELNETNCSLKQELALQETTRACLKDIVELVKTSDQSENAKLLEELEEKLATDLCI